MRVARRFSGPALRADRAAQQPARTSGSSTSSSVALVVHPTGWLTLFYPRGLLDQVVAPWFPRGVPWLTSPVLALPSVITVDIWKTTGYYMIVLLAGLLAIPIEYLEAAAIYGAGPWARVQHILLPLLRPQLVPLVFAVPIRWLPSARQWQNYVLPFQKTVGRYFLNSVIVLGAQTLGPLLLCSLAGYRLAKFRYPGRGLAFVFILSTVMLPIQVTLVPTFLIVKDLGWVNSCGGLIVPGLATTFGTFLMRQFFLSVPRHGLTRIFTGDGEGKTPAAVGLTVRAAGGAGAAWVPGVHW